MTATAVDRTRAGLDLLASLVLEDGHRWGEVAVPAQWDDATAVLDPHSPTPFSYQTRSRGYSKTADLGGIAVAVMLEQLPSASRLYGLAADRDQGRLLIDSVAGLAARTPGLSSALKVDAYRVTATRTGSTLDIIPADAPGAYGLRPAFLVVDEIAQWASTTGPRQLWEATTTAMGKVPGSRMVVLTSAGDPAHWSYRVLEHARQDPLWRVHEVPGPSPWMDPARLEEQRRRLPESSFRRLFLNEWTPAEDRLTNLDDLRACITHDDPLDYDPRREYVIGVDLGLTHDRTAIAVAHGERSAEWERLYGEHSHFVRDAHGRTTRFNPWSRSVDDPQVIQRVSSLDSSDISGVKVVLDRLIVFSGNRLRPVRLADVEAAIEQAAKSYGGARVITDPWQSVGMSQRLRTRGVRVTEFPFTAASVGRLGSTLHLLARSRALGLPADEALIDELANVRLRETTPGVLRLDHDAGRHDDRAIALALAAYAIVERHSVLVTGSRSYVDLRDRGRR